MQRSTDNWFNLGYDPDNENLENDATEGTDLIPFDQSLPATHSYLLLREIEEKYLWLRPSSNIQIPLLARQDVVLFPNERLPLVGDLLMWAPLLKAIGLVEDCPISQCALRKKDKPFGGFPPIGVVNELHQRALAPYGVTGHIIKFSMTDRKFSLLLEGKQRFRLFSSYKDEHVIWGNVAILPAEALPTLKPSRSTAAYNWPKWIIPSYHPRLLIQPARDACIGVIEQKGMPHDPIEASFWIARNLILDNHTRLMLLAAEMPERSAQLLQILSEFDCVRCRGCHTKVASTSHIFSMSSDGPTNSFVNSHGWVHDTISFRSLEIAPLLIGGKQTKDSWFKGYAWIISMCPSCSQHLGWQFVACSRGLSPASFWGLSRVNLLRTRNR